MNFYTVLGVDKKATQADIKAAYRRLAMKYHPDRNIGKESKDAEAKFKQAKEAYETLSDPSKRATYDRNNSSSSFGGYSSGSGKTYRREHSWDEYEDLFKRTTEEYGRYGKGFGSDFESEEFKRDYADYFNDYDNDYDDEEDEIVEMKLKVPLSTVIYGGTLNVDTGSRVIEVKIPKGVKEGQKILCRGMGSASGRTKKDLHLKVEYSGFDKSIFTIASNGEIIAEQTVSVFDYMLKDKIAFKHPTDGELEITITGNSKVEFVKVPGRGYPVDINSDERGALYVKFIMDVPRDLPPHVRKILEGVQLDLDSRSK